MKVSIILVAILIALSGPVMAQDDGALNFEFDLDPFMAAGMTWYVPGAGHTLIYDDWETGFKQLTLNLVVSAFLNIAEQKFNFDFTEEVQLGFQIYFTCDAFFQHWDQSCGIELF